MNLAKLALAGVIIVVVAGCGAGNDMTPKQQQNMKNVMSSGLGPPGSPKGGGAGQAKHGLANNQPAAQPTGN